jgi:hypothetical protein
MPYAPGIQDISGQLIAQGMSQAGAARARAIESLGESISGGIKQYQQNQMFTNQALGKFGMGLQDPQFKQYVDSIINDEPNAPRVPEAIKKALTNAAAGKVDIYDAALLGSATEGYQQERMRAAQRQAMQFENLQRLAAASEALRKSQPQGLRMSIEDFQRLPSTIDATAKPIPGSPGQVEVTGYNLRAPSQPKTPIVIQGDAITRVVDPSDPTKILAQYENIKVGPGQRLVTEPAPTSAPASLPQFLPSGSMLGQAPAQPNIPVAALKAMTPSRGAMRIEDIPGGEAAQKAKAAVAAQISKAEREMRSAGNILEAIDIIKRNKEQTTFGVAPVGMFSGGRKMVSQPAVNIGEALSTIKANIGFLELRDLKESGTSIGNLAIKELENFQALQGSLSQDLGKPEFDRSLKRFENNAAVRIQRIKLLKDAYDAGKTELEGEEKKRFDQLGNLLLLGEKQADATGTQAAAGQSSSNVKRLNVQRGQSAGTSTLAPAAPDLSAFEGRVLVNPQGKRVRIVNGKEVPLQ